MNEPFIQPRRSWCWTITCTLFAVFAMFAAFVSFPNASMAQAPSIEEAARIRDLIKQLGAPKFEQRESAQRELEKLLPKAIGPLERAAADSDPERSARAKLLLGRLAPPSHVIIDALGKPIPHAEVRLHRKTVDEKPVVQVSDAEGRVRFAAKDYEYEPRFEMRHVEYGFAVAAEPTFESRNNEVKTLRFPVAPDDSEAAQRAVHGRVVNAAGEAIANVQVRCNSVRTAGQGLIQPKHPLGAGLTDAEGRFRVYPAAQDSHSKLPEHGVMIPPQSSFELHLEPADEAHFPVAGMYRNGKPQRIVLPDAAQLHQLRFQTKDGKVKRPDQFQNLIVRYMGPAGAKRQPLEGSQPVTLSAATLRDGRRLALGVYRAQYYLNSRQVEFEPLTVTADSPEVLEFRLPPPTVFEGRVLDGVSQQPLKHAWVMGWYSTSYNNLASLTDEEWAVLEQAKPAPDQIVPEDSSAMELMRRHYGVVSLGSADETGKFQLTQHVDATFYGIMVFAKDYVPSYIRCGSLGKGEQVKTGDLQLFPAAKVWVQLQHEERTSISPHWVFDKQNRPSWLERLEFAANGAERDVAYVHWMKRNERTPVFVPANVKLKLRFEAPYADEWAPVDSKSFQLSQGEELDLEDVKLASSVRMDVKVIDEQGMPLEGVPVRRKHDNDGGWCVAHNTDKSGVAQFFVYPNTSGKVRILDLRGPDALTKAGNLEAAFQVGSEDLPPATIQLTKKQVELFRQQ